MTDTFDRYAEFVLLAEGAFSDHHSDKGGKTQFGLSSPFLKSIGMSGQIITKDRAIEIYRQYFWEGYRCHQMDSFVGFCACDAYVNHSPKAAAIILQQGLGVDVDGRVGPMTMNAAKEPNVRLFWQRYRQARIDYYQDLVDSDPTQQVFIRGWNGRLHKLIEAIYFAGLLKAESQGIMDRLASKPVKVTTAGIGVGSLVAAFDYLTGSPTLTEFISGSAPLAALVGTVSAWLTSLNIRK